MPARTRSTPYPVQLDTRLSALGAVTATLSALSLMAEFDHPRGQSRKTSLGQISKALHRAFGEDRLISYIDDEGRVLREQERGASGSAAIEHPQIYGTPGTPSPDEGFHPCTYQEFGDARHARGLVADE